MRGSVDADETRHRTPDVVQGRRVDGVVPTLTQAGDVEGPHLFAHRIGSGAALLCPSRRVEAGCSVMLPVTVSMRSSRWSAPWGGSPASGTCHLFLPRTNADGIASKQRWVDLPDSDLPLHVSRPITTQRETENLTGAPVTSHPDSGRVAPHRRLASACPNTDQSMPT